MPFPMIYGLPEETPNSLIKQIRASIITELAKALRIPTTIIRPFFPNDRADDPDAGQDNTIYCRLDSGMFNGKSAEERKKATATIAEVLWRAFHGLFEVEVYIGDLDGSGRAFRKPALKVFLFESRKIQVVYIITDYGTAPGVNGVLNIEGYMSEKGTLTVKGTEGDTRVYTVEDPQQVLKIQVRGGETMQWEAVEYPLLEFSEVCFPQYEDDWFEDSKE